MLCLLYIPWGVKAHQPDLSSTLLVEQADNKWVLHVRAALTAFEYEIDQHFGADSYATPEEFQQLLLNHVKDNVSILYNGKDAAVLQNGIVKLGHETSVTFEVVGTPETMKTLRVKNSSFSHISRNQSAIIILKKGFSKCQFILNSSNKHSIKLEVENSKFELISPAQEMSPNSIRLFVAISLFSIFLYFVYKHNKINKVTLVAAKKYSNFSSMLARKRR